MKSRIALIPFVENNTSNRLNPFMTTIDVVETADGSQHYYEDKKYQKQIPDETNITYSFPELLYGMPHMRHEPTSVVIHEFVKPDGVNKLNPFDYAKYIASQIPLKHSGDHLYEYYNGYYHEMSKNDQYNLVMKCCGNEICKAGNPGIIKKIVTALKYLPEIQYNELEENPDLIPFQNGFLDIGQMVFSPSDSSHFFRYSVTTNYEPWNNECPVFMNYLNTITGYNWNMNTRILEIIGYLITAHTDAKKFFVFAGVGNSGKSLLINVIESLISQNSVFSASMNDLGTQFTMGYMNGAQLCVCSDLSSAPITKGAVGNIKMLTGGDTIFCEKKNGPRIRMRKNTRLLFSTNHEITTVYPDKAFMDRCCVVPFLYSIPISKQDPYLFEKLYYERPAIVNAALNAYISMRVQRYGMGVEFTGEAEAQLMYHSYFQR